MYHQYTAPLSHLANENLIFLSTGFHFWRLMKFQCKAQVAWCFLREINEYCGGVWACTYTAKAFVSNFLSVSVVSFCQYHLGNHYTEIVPLWFYLWRLPFTVWCYSVFHHVCIHVCIYNNMLLFKWLLS